MPQGKSKSDLSHEQRNDIYVSKNISKAEKTEIERLGFTAFYSKHPEKLKEINNSTGFSNQHEKLSGAVDFYEKKSAQRYAYIGDGLSPEDEIDIINERFLRFGRNIEKLEDVYNLIRDTVDGLGYAYTEQTGFSDNILANRIKDYKEIISGVFSHIESNGNFSTEISDLLGSHLTLMHDIMISKKFGEQPSEYQEEKIQDMQSREDNIDSSISNFRSIFERMKSYCNGRISSIQDEASLISFHAKFREEYEQLEAAFDSINMAKTSIRKIVNKLL